LSVSPDSPINRAKYKSKISGVSVRSEANNPTHVLKERDKIEISDITFVFLTKD